MTWTHGPNNHPGQYKNCPICNPKPPKTPRKRGVTQAQVGLVLAAVANIEMWDAQHPSIQSTPDGEWRKGPEGYPEPSYQLMVLIRKLEEIKRKESC